MRLEQAVRNALNYDAHEWDHVYTRPLTFLEENIWHLLVLDFFFFFFVSSNSFGTCTVEYESWATLLIVFPSINFIFFNAVEVKLGSMVWSLCSCTCLTQEGSIPYGFSTSFKVSSKLMPKHASMWITYTRCEYTVVSDLRYIYLTHSVPVRDYRSSDQDKVPTEYEYNCIY